MVVSPSRMAPLAAVHFLPGSHLLLVSPQIHLLLQFLCESLATRSGDEDEDMGPMNDGKESWGLKRFMSRRVAY